MGALIPVGFGGAYAFGASDICDASSTGGSPASEALTTDDITVLGLAARPPSDFYNSKYQSLKREYLIENK